MSEVGSGMNIGSDYSGTEKTEKTDKATLRHHILSRRKRVPAEERGAAGELLVRRFPAHMIQDGPTVAAYVSMGSEIETRPLLRWLRAHGCHVLVPRLGSGLEIGWSVLDSLESLRSMDAVGGANNAGSCSSPSTCLLYTSTAERPRLNEGGAGFLPFWRPETAERPRGVRSDAGFLPFLTRCGY